MLFGTRPLRGFHGNVLAASRLRDVALENPSRGRVPALTLLRADRTFFRVTGKLGVHGPFIGRCVDLG